MNNSGEPAENIVNENGDEETAKYNPIDNIDTDFEKVDEQFLVNRKPRSGLAKRIIVDMASGVPPSEGCIFIACERKEEVDSINDNLSFVADGYSTLRFIEGNYGAGKSFMKQIIKYLAHNTGKNGYVEMDAQLSEHHLFTGSSFNKQGLNTYRELIRSMSTKTNTNGNAMKTIIQKFFENVKNEIIKHYDIRETKSIWDIDWRYYEPFVKKMTSSMSNAPHYEVFIDMLRRYFCDLSKESETFISPAVKWFKGEFNNVTELNNEFGKGQVRTYVRDNNWYDFIKLWSEFVVCVGYNGLIITFDEFKVLTRISSPKTREKNYNELLHMYDDLHGKHSNHLAIYICATPDSIKDETVGAYSYDALKSRLQGYDGIYKDLLGPVLRLIPITSNGAVALLWKLKEIFEIANSKKDKELHLDITLDDVKNYVGSKYAMPGSSKLITPRALSKAYIIILDNLRRNPDMSFPDIAYSTVIENDKDPLDGTVYDIEL